MPEKKWYRVRLIFPFDIIVQGDNEDDAVTNSAKSFLVHEGEFLVHEATPKDLEEGKHNKRIAPAMLVESEAADAT